MTLDADTLTVVLRGGTWDGPSRLDDGGDDHRPTPDLAAHPAPTARRITCWSSWVSRTPREIASSSAASSGPDLVEDHVILDKAAGGDLRPGRDLAGHRVDDDDHRDEALVAQDPAILEQGLVGTADARAVDVDVAAGARRRRSETPRRPGRRPRRPRPAPHDRRHPVATASSAFATRCRHSPCTGMTLRGWTML